MNGAAGGPCGFTQRRNSCELQWRALRSRPKRHQSRSSPHHGGRLGNSKEGKLCWNLEIWHHEWVSNAQGYNFKMDRPAILTADESNILQVPGNEWAEFKLGHAGVIKKVWYENYIKYTSIIALRFETLTSLRLCRLKSTQTTSKETFLTRATLKVSSLNWVTSRVTWVQYDQLFSGCNSSDDKPSATTDWKMILAPKKLSAHKRHYYEGDEVIAVGVVTFVRLTMAPDGGISRMRLWGYKS